MAPDGYSSQVGLLVRVLPIIAREPMFALKGGTAINLFYRDLPRLSVDIDLTYLPIADRGESLEDINRCLAESYPKIVSLYREFLLRLRTDASIVTGNSSDGQLAQQLGEQPFIRAQQIADALMPYIRRLPSGGAKA